MFEKRLKEIMKRRAEIRTMLEGNDEVDIDELNRELDALDTEEANLNQRRAAAERISRSVEPEGEPAPVNPITRAAITRENASGTDSRAANLAALQGIRVEEAQSRAESFAREGRMNIPTGALQRSLTLSGGNIAQPHRVSGINPAQNTVSGIIDMVNVIDANGMGEDSVAYEEAGMTAGTKKDDGSAASESTPTLKIAKITPTLVTTLGYVSRNIQRTTPLNYQERVSDAALRALRTKVSRLIVGGDPAASIPEPTGILKAAAIQSGTDFSIEAINEKTLRNIALRYGGDDNLEGGGVLLLNKKDLVWQKQFFIYNNGVIGNNGNIWVHWSAYPNNYEFNKNENGKLIARGGYGDTQLKIISGGYNVSGYSMLHVVGNYELNIANYGEDWFGLSSVANDYNPNICNQYMKIGDTAKSFHLQIPFSFNGTAYFNWRFLTFHKMYISQIYVV